MNKKIGIFFLILIAFLNLGAFGKPKKIKCNKPIYFFENVQKNVFFDNLDSILQEGNFELKKFYPELGFISVKYKAKHNSQKIVGLNLKQFGNDVYLFIDIDKNNTELENFIYKNLKKHTQNSYLLRDDFFCKELSK